MTQPARPAVELIAASPSTSDEQRTMADARAAFDHLPPAGPGDVLGVDPYDLAGSA